jgi:hypothetical protein
VTVIDGYGILESYVIRARNGDKQGQALAFPLITDLVKEDSEINGKLEGYRPHILTNAFKREEAKFQEHAHTYILRVQSLPAVIETGAPFSRWKQFPAGFPPALLEEIAKRRGQPPPDLDFQITEKSDFPRGGYTQKQWCDNVILATKTEYPNAALSVVNSSEETQVSDMSGEHGYSCTIRVQGHR